MSEKSSKFEDASLKVDWALAESYKKAVKLRGIVSWGDYSKEESFEQNKLVEAYQIEIAKMLLELVK